MYGLLISLIYLKFVLLRFFFGGDPFGELGCPGFLLYDHTVAGGSNRLDASCAGKIAQIKFKHSVFHFSEFLGHTKSCLVSVGWIKIADLLGRTRQRENKLRMLKMINYV